jgi:formylmethanofuran dehydrogenase subunit B
MPMSDARIDGRPVTLEAAVAAAAKLLAASRLPVFAGLGTDIAGARAAIALAERLGGVIDHMHSDALLRDLAVMREAGAYVTSPNEARLRGDTLLLVGPELVETWPDLGERLLAAPLAPEIGGKRRVFWFCPGKSEVPPGMKVVGRSAGGLPEQLALLRAGISGRLLRVPKAIADLAKALQAARFGVAVWSAAALDELTIEMLFGLIDELNATARFTGLPLAPADNALGVTQASGWMTGFPPRTGFGRGYPEHDPWRFEARRLVESGEADCVVWVSAYDAERSHWVKNPHIALTPDTSDQNYSGVLLQVGRPTLDHDAIEHDAMTGTLVARAASRASDMPSVADVIARIAAALPGGAWPC